MEPFEFFKHLGQNTMLDVFDQIGSIYGGNVLRILIQICVDKSQRRFQFSAAHFQEFIDGEWEPGLFLWDLSKEYLSQFFTLH